jgi:hypothetical protein
MSIRCQSLVAFAAPASRWSRDMTNLATIRVRIRTCRSSVQAEYKGWSVHPYTSFPLCGILAVLGAIGDLLASTVRYVCTGEITPVFWDSHVSRD